VAARVAGRWRTPERFIAVDWSGRVDERGQRESIWLCEYMGDHCVRLEAGRTREEVTRELVRVIAEEPNVVLGLDFGFAFPAWFMRDVAGGRATTLWDLVAREGERWLAECAPPFWGRPGRAKPAADVARPEFRHCELVLPPVAGTRPKSMFQVGGAGSVGTGSLRGMPTLSALLAAGARIWPFQQGELPFVCEIYPRLLTGPVVKSDASARARHLQALSDIPAWAAALASASEDAFDALLSARALAHDGEYAVRRVRPTALERLEGTIWTPARPAALTDGESR
jgi:hypothetical protein